jgi:hypothetical protein
MGGIEAQSGFYYQNVLGALRALDLIELGNPLFSVSFDNPAKAQYIDDIVAEGTGFVEFTQVKWAEDEDASFTLANLTAVDDSSGKSLLQKIAEAFVKSRGSKGPRRLFSIRLAQQGQTPSPPKDSPRACRRF